MSKKLILYIPIAAVVIFIIISGYVKGDPGTASLTSVLLTFTLIVVPWLFLYWFIRLVKAYEKKNSRPGED